MHVQRVTGETKAAPAERFAGQVWLEVLSPPTSAPGLEVFDVHFAPGGRTAWHTHPKGQVFVVTEGAGLVQSSGQEVHAVQAGDTVIAEPGERHWHGAGPHSFMSHIAVQAAGPDGVTTDWGEHVSDADYPSA